MKETPTFSVVTISFNQAQFLERAIESVLAQEGVDIEYIVIDPGSTDGSREIIERYHDRLSTVIFEPDAGPADGLNKGLALSSGDFFYYLNSDDRVRPNAFKEAAEEFHNNPHLDVVYANGYATDENDNIVRKIYSDRKPTTLTYALGVSVFVQQSTFFRTRALRDVGGFNVDNRCCWDGELMFNLMSARKNIKRVWRFWSEFRIYGSSITGSDRLKADIASAHARIGSRYEFIGQLRPAVRTVTYLRSRLTDFRQLNDRIIIKHLENLRG